MLQLLSYSFFEVNIINDLYTILLSILYIEMIIDDSLLISKNSFPKTADSGNLSVMRSCKTRHLCT